MNQALNGLALFVSPGNQDRVNRSRGMSIRRKLEARSCSAYEAAQLEQHANQKFVADLNQLTISGAWQTIGLGENCFDLILLSHVLERLQDPAKVLDSICSLLTPNGLLLIALPNICHWRTRLQIPRGSFQYQDSGILDHSHLRFFTYWSARELVEECRSVKQLNQWPVGGAILGPVRARLPHRMSCWLDRQAAWNWPNLFGFETHLMAPRR